MNSKKQQAIILAAGMGTRLLPITDTIPKCLLEVNGKSILLRQLEILEDLGITETALVVGYLKEKIMKTVGSDFRSMKITYIENHEYKTTNNIYSLWLARDYLRRGCILLESDIVFEKDIIRMLLESEKENIAIVDVFNPRMDGTVVTIDAERKIREIILKQEQKEDFNFSDKLKTVNIYKFSSDFADTLIIPQLKQYIKNNDLNNFYEIVLKEIISMQKANIYALIINHMNWMEIDDQNDLKITEVLFG